VNLKKQCAVCGRRDGALSSFRGLAWLCETHHEVARGLIPRPHTLEELRALFPARVLASPRGRAA
jgi:hypothetical protein